MKSIEKIEVLCPNSEIFIVTLPPSKLYTDANRIAYNEVIVKYANEFELPVIDMANAYDGNDVSNYLVDSAHQNLAGMTAVAEEIVEGMLKSKGIENVNTNRKGDMYVVTKVIIPEKLTKEQRKLFENLQETELENTTFIKKFK
jgi:hypothetical protein